MELNIYHCTLEHWYVDEIIDDFERYEYDTHGGLFVAASRGKARYMLAKVCDEEFTYPMVIKKINHSIPQCELTIGELEDYALVVDGSLLHVSKLDEYLDKLYANKPDSE